MQAMQMNSSVSGQQTERILLARIADILSGTPSSSSSSSSSSSGIQGNVGGFTSLVKFTQATSNATYAAGRSVGGLITLTSAVRTPGTGIIESVTLWDLAHNAVALDLLIFDAAPTTTPADNSAWSAVAADALKLLGRIAIAAADWVTYNNISFVTEKGLGINVKAASGTTLYGVLLCNGSAPVFTAASQIGGLVSILQD